MKKLLVFSPYYPPHVGGLESHAAEFNEKISTEGYSVTVFTPNLPEKNEGSEKIELEDKANSIHVIRYPAFELIPNYPLPKFWKRVFYLQLFLLSRENFTVVISRTRFFVSTLMAMMFAKISNKKWLHVEHGSDFPKLKNRIINFIAWLCDHTFGRLVFMLADVVVCNSQASINFAITLYKKRKYLAVYRGINEEKIASTKAFDKEKMGYGEKIIVSYVGRLINGKGVADLLHALANLGDLPLACWIIGNGPEKENLEQLAKELKIEQKVVFWGEKSFCDAISLLKASDIFVNPSYTEGMPTAVIEAALCRLPIIATNVGGTEEIVCRKSEVMFFSPHAVGEISNAIRALEADVSLRRNMGNNAYNAVSGKFTWEKSMVQYKNILRGMENGYAEGNSVNANF